MPPTTVRLAEIVDLYDDRLLPWLRLYERAFPPAERVLVASLLAAVKRRRRALDQRLPEGEIMLAVLDGDERFAGLMQYECFSGGAAALWYFAVEPERRGQGLGGLAYRRLLEVLAPLGVDALVFEVEIPDEAPGEAARRLAERRIAFYRRLGARLLRGADHLQTVDDAIPPLPMHVMVQPLRPLDAEESYARARIALGESVSRRGALALE